jgi:PPP family 3-phenylpropionic acid transporter
MNKGILLNYGLARGIGSISFAIMSYFLGFMIDAKGAIILLPFFLFASFGLTVSTFTFQLSTKAKNTFNDANILLHDPIPNKNLSKGSLISFFLKYKKFSIHLIGVTLIITCHSMINTYLIQILEHVGGSSKHLGISLSIAAALELPTMAIYVMLTRKMNSGILLKVAAFFLTIKAGILIFAFNVPMVYLSQAFQLISYALFIPASVDYVNKIMAEEDKVKGQAFAGVATMGMSGILGNLIAGQIISNAGVTYMVITSAIISTFGFIILFFSTENSY